jgi:3-methyl-2-oxobutanoate hydroxymethyltransferase
MKSGKVRIATLLDRKRANEKIVMVTAYDYPTGRLADEAGVDVVLVGDSLGNVVLGYENPIPVTLDAMVHHTAAVRRGVRRALLVADMPFLEGKLEPEAVLRNAGRLVQEGGAEAVKLEGGAEIAPAVRRVAQAGIPVMGHVGLTPQSVHALSGYGVRGREAAEAERLLADAQALAEAGCFAIVLECLTWDLGGRIGRALTIPTIGIGAGAECDGQVLVLADLLGLTFEKPARFVKRYAEIGNTIRDAVAAYAAEVRSGVYPDRSHAYVAKQTVGTGEDSAPPQAKPHSSRTASRESGDPHHLAGADSTERQGDSLP